MRHFAVLAALVAACGGEALPRVCESGRTQACACVGGGQGAQVCALSGLSWGACVCGDGGAADATQTAADAPAMPDGGSDAATAADAATDATDGQAEAAADASVDAAQDHHPAADGPAMVDATSDGGCPVGYGMCTGTTCVNLATSRMWCGACSAFCGPAADCVDGRCTTRATGVSCSAGTGDCDGVAANGCEVDTLTSFENCGGCGRSCGSARMMCRLGACVVAP